MPMSISCRWQQPSMSRISGYMPSRSVRLRTCSSPLPAGSAARKMLTPRTDAHAAEPRQEGLTAMDIICALWLRAMKRLFLCRSGIRIHLPGTPALADFRRLTECSPGTPGTRFYRVQEIPLGISCTCRESKNLMSGSFSINDRGNNTRSVYRLRDDRRSNSTSDSKSQQYCNRQQNRDSYQGS